MNVFRNNLINGIDVGLVYDRILNYNTNTRFFYIPSMQTIYIIFQLMVYNFFDTVIMYNTSMVNGNGNIVRVDRCFRLDMVMYYQLVMGMRFIYVNGCLCEQMFEVMRNYREASGMYFYVSLYSVIWGFYIIFMEMGINLFYWPWFGLGIEFNTDYGGNWYYWLFYIYGDELKYGLQNGLGYLIQNFDYIIGDSNEVWKGYYYVMSHSDVSKIHLSYDYIRLVNDNLNVTQLKSVLEGERSEYLYNINVLKRIYYWIK